MIKSLSEQQNKIRILGQQFQNNRIIFNPKNINPFFSIHKDNDNDTSALDFNKSFLQNSLSDANGQIKLENIPPLLLNFDFSNLNGLNYFNTMTEKISNPSDNSLSQVNHTGGKYTKKTLNNVLAKLRVNAETMSTNNTGRYILNHFSHLLSIVG